MPSFRWLRAVPTDEESARPESQVTFLSDGDGDFWGCFEHGIYHKKL